MSDEIKVGDFVAAKHSVGKVVEVTPERIRIEVPKGHTGDVRYTELNKKQADELNITLAELIKRYIIKVVKL